MRKKDKKQLPLMIASVDHPHAVELELISQILNENPIINELVLQDLTHGVNNPASGANGMSAEQVLRAAVIKQMNSYSYEELAFHILDSVCYRSFCHIGFADKGFGKSALCGNIKAISSETWEAINRILVGVGQDKGIEKGRQTRIDCTVVSSNIHEPTDSSILFDCVRVLTRILGQLKDMFKDLSIVFSDHTKRAKRRMLEIMNAKDANARKSPYMDLLKVTKNTVNYAQSTISFLEATPCMLTAQSAVDELNYFIDLTQRVINQTERRMINGEAVPASEKIVSIFEPHTDIIKKDRRETYYGPLLSKINCDTYS